MAYSFLAELKRRNVIKVGTAYLVLVWIIIQITSEAVPALHLPEWVNSLVFYFGIIGFPFAIFFAWAFELTPDGLKREQEVQPADSISYQIGSKLIFIIIGLLVIAASYFIWESQINNISETTVNPTSNNTSPRIQKEELASLAVLAFADLSPLNDQGYFADGISEEILNVLVKVTNLDIASRTSSFQFKNKELGIPQIAKQLGVHYLVQGSVRKAGTQIKVTAQLIDAIEDRYLWSDTYDMPLNIENVFAIQEEIAISVVDALNKVLVITDNKSVTVGKSTNNLNAYELFLEARQLYQERTELDRAKILLAQAIRLDPKFAKAIEIQAAVQSLLVYFGYSKKSIEESQAIALQLAKRAISIDPDSATAIALQARIQHESNLNKGTQFDIAMFLKTYDRSLSIDSRNISALNWRGLMLLLVGNFSESLSDFEKCKKIEPNNLPCINNRIRLLAILGNDTAALDAYKDAISNGINIVPYSNFALLARQKKETAFKVAANHPKLLAGWRRHNELYLAYQNPSADHSELASEILEFPSKIDSNDPLTKQMLLSPISPNDVRPDQLTMWDPSLNYYRKTDDFKNYIRETGVFSYWQKHGFPDLCHPVGIDDFICD